MTLAPVGLARAQFQTPSTTSNQETHNKAPKACEEGVELKPVGQLSDRCGENHPTLPA